MRRGRPFEPGNKFGQGRPRGSKNKGNAALELLGKHYPHVVSKLILSACDADPGAMRLFLREFHMQVSRNRPKIRVNPINTQADCAEASKAVTLQVLKGKIPAEEGQKMIEIVKGHSQLVLGAELEARVTRLEAHHRLKEAA